MTYQAKIRAYYVQMYALSEERRVCGMDEDTWRERCREILDNCGLTKTPGAQTKRTPET